MAQVGALSNADSIDCEGYDPTNSLHEWVRVPIGHIGMAGTITNNTEIILNTFSTVLITVEKGRRNVAKSKKISFFFFGAWIKIIFFVELYFS